MKLVTSFLARALLLTGIISPNRADDHVESMQPHGHGPCVPGKDGEKVYEQRLPVQNLASVMGERIPCEGGYASIYPCRNVDLLSFVPAKDLTGTGEPEFVNDIWGWTNPDTNVEYAIVGMEGGTSFVDLSDSVSPVVVGYLPTQTVSSFWRDIKVYNNHAFIVSEAPDHGIQIYDMMQLANMTSFTTLENTAFYNGLGSAHNVFINEDSGFAYVVGAFDGGCSSGGLHMVDISDPVNPTFAGCYASDGYTHDVQCVIYDGPDGDYTGQEICFASNEDNVVITDVTDKSNVKKISTLTYDCHGYTHQGWLTENKSHFLIDDESDELKQSSSLTRTRTIIADVSDLDSPKTIGDYNADVAAIDHNLYIKGNFVYQANYRAGLRVLDLSSVSSGNVTEKAYFDVYPSSDSDNFNGAWSVYPYFESGIVVVSGIEQGLFVLEVDYDFPDKDVGNKKEDHDGKVYQDGGMIIKVLNKLLG